VNLSRSSFEGRSRITTLSERKKSGTSTSLSFAERNRHPRHQPPNRKRKTTFTSVASARLTVADIARTTSDPKTVRLNTAAMTATSISAVSVTSREAAEKDLATVAAI